jgi:succinate dehydrogenase / fumarate reductase, cytochrome b subunit
MSFTNSVIAKKWMAIAGLVWFSYIIFHLLTLLVFHQGAQAFNDFYHHLNQFILYDAMVMILAIFLTFHTYVAISRQNSNSKSKGASYKKSYPGEIPRVVVWIGSSLLFIFIIIHFIQMKILINNHWYQEINGLLSQPFMWIFYAGGLIALVAHLYHGLTNVLQTLGVTHCSYQYLVILIALILFVSFSSILMSVAL